MNFPLLFFLFTILSFNLYAQNDSRLLTSFSEFVSALDKGKSITAIFHYGKCKLLIDSVEQKSPEVKGGMKIDEFEYFPANSIRNPVTYLAFSKTVLINHSRHGYVWNYVKCRVYENRKVEINARYVDPKSWDTLMNETFLGELSTSFEDRGVYLYLD